MRARIVAIECGTSRSVVGAFVPTADGELMLDEFALLHRAGDPAEVVWPELPATLRVAERFAVAPPAIATYAKAVAVPRLARAKRARVVRFEAEQAIPRPLAEVVWDWAPAPEGGDAVELVAMRRDAAAAWTGEADRVGARLETIVARSTALVRAVRHNYPEVAGSALVVECDGAAALLVRLGRGAPVVRLVGLPEPMPVEAGCGSTVVGESGESLRLRRLAAEIARAGAPEGDAEAVDAPVVFLAGADGPGRAELERALGGLARVESFDALRRVQLGPQASGAAALAHQFGVVVGAALVACDPAAPNLLPPERRRANDFRRRRTSWLSALGAAVVVVWAVASWCHFAALREERAMAARHRDLAPWRAAQAEVQALRRETEMHVRELAMLRGLERSRTSWPRLLAGLERCAVQAGGVWLETLQVVPPGGAPAAGWFGHPAPIAGSATTGLRLAVTGRASDPGEDGRRGLERVRGWLAEIAALEEVGAVEAERFDGSAEGVLRFGCVVVLKPEAGL